jgi:HEAT repeat protein
VTLPRRKKLVLGLVAAGVLVLCGALLSVQDRLRETWYLWKFDTTEDPASRAQIIERLGRVGGERSFRALCLRVAEECPFFILAWGLWKEPLVPLEPVSEACGEYARAINLTRQKLGRTKAIAIMVDILRTQTVSLRARVYAAQPVVMVLCPGDALPRELKAAIQFPIDPGTPEWVILREAQPDAIGALLSGLESEDVYARAGASFALSLCGPEASMAIPALKQALQDENETVRMDAADALRRIEGQE